MRLDELKPSIFKNIRHDTETKTGASPALYYKEIMPYLEKHGYEEITDDLTGYAHVYVSPTSSFVIKVSKKEDPCYLAFAKYAQANFKNDQHLPKLKILKFDRPGFFVSFIEKLDDLEQEEMDKINNAGAIYGNLAMPSQTYKDLNLPTPLQSLKNQGKRVDIDGKPYDPKEELRGFVRDNYSFFKSLTKIRKNISGCKFDLHGGNVMKRKDGTLVFTDPVSYRLSRYK